MPRRAQLSVTNRSVALAIAHLLVVSLSSGASEAPAPSAERPLSTAEVLAASAPDDWRPLDPARTVYLELPSGRVVIELAQAFAPRHVANLETLMRQGYFDGLAILRSQDNYVVQWGDPDGEDEKRRRPLGEAKTTLPMEVYRASEGLPFLGLADGDVYAPEVGFSGGFPVARDPATGRAWLTHCYGMVGAGRAEAPDSGNAAELYVVTGHSPRHLDPNVTLLGRVVDGMPLLSTLPRGSGPLGFYERPEERVPIRAMRLASSVPEAERTPLEVLRTDTATFAAFVESRRRRHEEWFVDPVGHVELCNVAVPTRLAAVAAMAAAPGPGAEPPSAESSSQGDLPDPLAAGWHGKRICELLREDELARMLRCTLAPGDGHERHVHAPHAGYTLVGGRMQITDASGTEVRELPTAGSWTTPGGAWHEVVNVGDTTAVFLIVEPKDRVGE